MQLQSEVQQSDWHAGQLRLWLAAAKQYRISPTHLPADMMVSCPVFVIDDLRFAPLLGLTAGMVPAELLLPLACAATSGLFGSSRGMLGGMS